MAVLHLVINEKLWQYSEVLKSNGICPSRFWTFLKLMISFSPFCNVNVYLMPVPTIIYWKKITSLVLQIHRWGLLSHGELCLSFIHTWFRYLRLDFEFKTWCWNGLGFGECWDGMNLLCLWEGYEFLEDRLLWVELYPPKFMLKS